MKLKMDKSVIGDSLTKEYGIPENYRIFRHIFYHKGKEDPEALFMIKFQLKRMNPKLNVLFSYSTFPPAKQEEMLDFSSKIVS